MIDGGAVEDVVASGWGGDALSWPEKREAALRLLARGRRACKVAEAVCVSERTVYRWQAGKPTRP